MKTGILWAIGFAIAALIVFPFLAPFLFRGSDLRQVGAQAFPWLLLAGGSVGFAVGFLLSRRQKPSQ